MTDAAVDRSARTDDAGADTGERVPSRRLVLLEQRLDRRRRRRRRLAIALAVLVAAAFVSLDVVTVLTTRDQDATREELEARRTTIRRRIGSTEESTSRTSDAIGQEVGQRDMARWFAALTQLELDSSNVELGSAQATTNALQSRIDALNGCINGVNQTLAQLGARDRAGASVTLGLVSPSCNEGIGATGGRAPVLAFDFPDPYVLRVGDRYYAYSTNGGGGDIQIATSPDLRQWSLAGNALARLPRWGAPNRTWAPAVLPRPGPEGERYVLFYTVGNPNRPSCISRAVSSSPTGPFVDESAGPLVCPGQGDAIDPSPFVDGDRAFLTWRGAEGRIWSQQLDAGGTSLVGDAHALVAPDQAWEHGVVEGPSMISAGGRYYLFYSAAKWSTREYAVGYALCDTPIGGCHKPQAGPAFASSDTRAAPGGQEFFTDTTGRLWMAYHAYSEPNVGYPNSRRLHLLPVEFDAAGVPVLRPPET
jgi:hypothetical protein